MEEIILTHENYINRELSFMEFNQRVLEEARDLSNPLFERLKFASIVTSNLEEFYMIRYGSLSDQIAAGLKKTDPSGLTPKEQTRAIDDRTRKLLADLYKTFNEELIPAARSVQFRILHREELKPEQLSYLNQLYEDSIFPVLTPMVIDSSRPFPLIMNNTLNIALHLLDSEGRAFWERFRFHRCLTGSIGSPEAKPDSSYYWRILSSFICRIFSTHIRFRILSATRSQGMRIWNMTKMMLRIS